MPIFRVTMQYKTNKGKVRRSLTRMAEVADFTKLTRPMKATIRRRYPKADIHSIRILKHFERATRTRKRR
jgi:hypothetical protein